MKRSTKRNIAVSCFTLALGCFLIAAGHNMGGSLGGNRSINIGGTNGIRIASSGIHIGGSNGIYVGPDGISIGGSNGIYVGPAGIRIGTSGAVYTEEEAIAIAPEEDRMRQEVAWGTTFYDGTSVIRKNVEVDFFESVSINIDLGDISVVQDGNGYFVELQNNIEGYELHYELDGAELVIWSEGEGSRRWSGTANATAQVTVIIPEGVTLKDLDLVTGLGSVTVVEPIYDR